MKKSVNKSTSEFCMSISEMVADSKDTHIYSSAELDSIAIDTLKSQFLAGDFIGISNPSVTSTLQLKNLLSLESLGDIADVSNSELYGLKKLSNTIEQIFVQKPVVPKETDFTQIDNMHRAQAALKMIQNIASESSAVNLAAAVGGGDPIDLFNQGIQYTNRVQWCLPVLNNSSKPLNCYYQIITKAQAVWVKDAAGNEYDYYFLIQYGVFSPAPGYFADDTNNQGWYTTFYNMDVYPENYLGNSAIFMAQNSPGTTQGVTNVTSSVNETTGISVGFFGDQFTANFSESVSIGTSTSYSIPDVKLQNASNSNGNNAQWSFEIPYVDGALSLSRPVSMAYNTFQPVNMMLWQADQSIRKDIESKTKAKQKPAISFKTDFTMQYVYTYVDGSRQDKLYKPDTQSVTFSVPLPPIQKPPPAL